MRANKQDHRIDVVVRRLTRKEAVVKALGRGLSYPLDRLHVGLRAGDPVTTLCSDGSAVGFAGWSVETLFPAKGYLGASATGVLPVPQSLFEAHSGPGLKGHRSQAA